MLWVLYLYIFTVISLIPLWGAYKRAMDVPSSGDWLFWMPVCLLSAFLICLFISIIVPRQIIRKEGLSGELGRAHKKNSRLKLICLGICTALLAGTFAVSIFTPLNTQLYASVSEGRHFDTFEEFKAYAETPVSVDNVGNIAEIYDPETNEVLHYEKDDEEYWFEDYLEDAQGNYYPFVRRNMNIGAYDYNEETFTDFVVWSKADVYALGEQIDLERFVFFILYVSEIVGMLLIYLWKRNKVFQRYRKQI